MAYDYLESMKADIKSALKCGNYAIEDGFDSLYDAMWVDDSITGNASGSYTFNSALAGEYICANWDLLVEACDEFCINIPKSAEATDVTIRCYLLHQVLEEVCNE